MDNSLRYTTILYQFGNISNSRKLDEKICPLSEDLLPLK